MILTKALKNWKKISEQIHTTKIKMDLREYKSIIETHQQKMASHQDAIERFENHFENKIKHAKIYPTRIVIIFIIVLLFVLFQYPILII